MEVAKKAIEKIVITCKNEEFRDAIEYCKSNSAWVTDVIVGTDPRSKEPNGEVFILAEKEIKQ